MIRQFARFARQESISDADLSTAIGRAERGLVDCDYGGGLIKQRIARPNEGSSGGFRSVIAYRSGDRAFFLYGFPKSDKGNITPAEKKALRKLAQEWLARGDKEIGTAIKESALVEVKYHVKNLQK